MTTRPHSNSDDNIRVAADPMARESLSQPHLLGIAGLTARDIQQILDLADTYANSNRGVRKHSDLCGGMTLANLFFENSTRTLCSFELAGKRLGMDVVGLSVATSSIKKGETLLDTALTINAMRPDAMVIRHFETGAVAAIAERMDCPVINAGDGNGEHPTQALADALTIFRAKGRLEGLTVAICGDIAHSRVARSNALLLREMGSEVRFVGPEPLLPAQAGAETFTDIQAGLKGADVVMMLRIQNERMGAPKDGEVVPSGDDYFRQYGLDRDKLGFAKDDAIVMHPGPMNRGVEIASEIADDTARSVILTQVEMGVAVRMACLDLLTRPKRGAE